jgi:AcrR family transcriptional regulator
MPIDDREIRADAARNRERLLIAAENLFSERGVDASVAEIATRAGVGKGTFFRHFASKDDLISAIVRVHVEELDAMGRNLTDAQDAGAALLEFLSFAAERQQQHDISFLMPASANDPAIAALRDRLLATVGTLLAGAQDAGAVRADVTGMDIVLLMCAPNHVVSYLEEPSPSLWRRYLAIVFDGLRPAGAHPLPDPSPHRP